MILFLGNLQPYRGGDILLAQSTQEVATLFAVLVDVWMMGRRVLENFLNTPVKII